MHIVEELVALRSISNLIWMENMQVNMEWFTKAKTEQEILADAILSSLLLL